MIKHDYDVYGFQYSNLYYLWLLLILIPFLWLDDFIKVAMLCHYQYVKFTAGNLRNLPHFDLFILWSHFTIIQESQAWCIGAHYPIEDYQSKLLMLNNFTRSLCRCPGNKWLSVFKHIQLHFMDRKCFTHWGWVTHICISKLTITGTHQVTSHYLNQWNARILLSGSIGTNFSEILFNSNIFIQENVSKNVVCKMVAILSQPQCVKFWSVMFAVSI